MGCPINSIEQLENGLRYRKQKNGSRDISKC